MAHADAEVEMRPDEEPEAREEPEAPQVPFLSVSGAKVSYASREILRGIDLAVDRGHVFVLLGPNGAGKSTLVKSIAGRITLDEGAITIDGGDPVRSARARRAAGFVPQTVAVYEQLTVIENLVTIGSVMGLSRQVATRRARAVVSAIGLSERVVDPACVLSGGLRRRLNIGMALVHGPRLLVLDEPTAGVDVAGRRAVIDLITRLRGQGLAILLTTHDMEEAESLADQVGIIVDGAIHASGPPQELITHLFGTSKELVARVHPQAMSEGSTVHFTLLRNGFKPDINGDTWRVLVKWTDADIADFVEHVLSNEPSVREMRVRRPGLDTVLAHFTRKA